MNYYMKTRQLTEKQLESFLEFCINPAYRRDFEPIEVVNAWPLRIKREVFQRFCSEESHNLKLLAERLQFLDKLLQDNN